MSTHKIPYVMTAKDGLDKVVARAKRNGQRFYIGVASQSGQSALDAVRKREKGGHHADKGVNDSYGLLLSRVNYTRLLKESSVCDLEEGLIAKHGDDPLCQNKKQGQNDCITADQGIVYIRTYSRGNSSAVGRPKKLGAAKETRKRSKYRL